MIYNDACLFCEHVVQNLFSMYHDVLVFYYGVLEFTVLLTYIDLVVCLYWPS